MLLGSWKGCRTAGAQGDDANRGRLHIQISAALLRPLIIMTGSPSAPPPSSSCMDLWQFSTNRAALELSSGVSAVRAIT